MRRFIALVTIVLLIASCSAIDDIEDDLSTVTLPDVTLPDVSLPDLTIPDITLPDVTLPDVTLPDVTLPDVSLPGATTTIAQFTTTTAAPATTTTTASATTTPTTTPTTTLTTAPAEATTTAVETTVPASTTTVVAAPSTTVVEEDEEQDSGISPWWLLVAVAVLVAAGYAVWRRRVEAARLAEWRERLRIAYLQGRWMEDQFDDRLIEERRADPDPRGLRVALEPVLIDIRRLEAEATDVSTRAALRELGDSMRGLDRAIDDAAGLTAATEDVPLPAAARARLGAATESLALLSNGGLPPPAVTG